MCSKQALKNSLKKIMAVFTIYEHTVHLGELTTDVIKLLVPLNTAVLPAL